MLLAFGNLKFVPKWDLMPKIGERANVWHKNYGWVTAVWSKSDHEPFIGWADLSQEILNLKTGSFWTRNQLLLIAVIVGSGMEKQPTDQNEYLDAALVKASPKLEGDTAVFVFQFVDGVETAPDPRDSERVYRLFQRLKDSEDPVKSFEVYLVSKDEILGS